MRTAALVISTVILSVVAFSADAATYYIRNGGNDSANGLSHATAWASLGRVNKQRMEPSDRVFLQSGDRFEGQLVVNWEGSSSQPAIVGAYYLKNGSPVRGFFGNRPVIDGNNKIPSNYDGLVRVTKPYVRVENLEVVKSEGRAIEFRASSHSEVVNCVTVDADKSGIKFLDSPYGLISGNTVRLAGRAWPEHGTSPGGAIEAVRSHHVTIANNTVSEVYGEGINANNGTRGAIIEDNHLYAIRSPAIYLDAAPDATIRRNIILGSTNPKYSKNGEVAGPGIAVNNEKYHYDNGLPAHVQSTNARIYNNLVAFTSTGITFWGQYDGSSFANALVFNNTLVDNDTQFGGGAKPKPGGKFVNNILLSLTRGTRDVDRNRLQGMAVGTNYFSKGNPGGDYGTGHLTSGLELKRMTGWRSIDSATYATAADFAIVDGSSAIGRGDETPKQMSQGQNTYNLDFHRVAHNSPMDLGGVRFSSGKRPKAPFGLVAAP